MGNSPKPPKKKETTQVHIIHTTDTAHIHPFTSLVKQLLSTIQKENPAILYEVTFEGDFKSYSIDNSSNMDKKPLVLVVKDWRSERPFNRSELEFLKNLKEQNPNVNLVAFINRNHSSLESPPIVELFKQAVWTFFNKLTFEDPVKINDQETNNLQKKLKEILKKQNE